MKYNININYFDNFNTEDKSYFLGLLFADGSNNGKKVSISLSGDDKTILEKMTQKIYLNYRPLIKSVLSEKNPNFQNSYTLFICNKQISQKLISLGMIPRKTYTLQFPEIINDKEKFRHFLRGYFDGDGSVIYNKKNITFSIVGNEKFLITLKSKMEKYIQIKIINKIYNTSSYAKEIKISSRKIVRKIFHFMYENALFYLERKKEKFIYYFNKSENLIDHVKTSKYKWICFDKKRNKWKASVWLNGKNNNIGRFEQELDAYNAALNYISDHKLIR